MIIKLSPDQITKYWETIRFAAIAADMVEEPYHRNYSINLLFNLLNGNYECFFSLSKDRQVQRVLIVSFMFEETIIENQMFFVILYSFTHGSQTEWAEESTQIYNYAKKRNCARIKITTKNPSIITLAKQYGFNPESENYSLVL